MTPCKHEILETVLLLPLTEGKQTRIVVGCLEVTRQFRENTSQRIFNFLIVSLRSQEARAVIRHESHADPNARHRGTWFPISRFDRIRSHFIVAQLFFLPVIFGQGTPLASWTPYCAFPDGQRQSFTPFTPVCDRPALHIRVGTPNTRRLVHPTLSLVGDTPNQSIISYHPCAAGAVKGCGATFFGRHPEDSGCR